MNTVAGPHSALLSNGLIELQEAVGRDDDFAISGCFVKLKPYLRRIACRYSSRECDWPNLEQVGFIAIVRAARRFDSGLGRPFEHYTRVAVKNAVLDEVRKTAEFYDRFESMETDSGWDDGRESCLEVPAPSPFDSMALAELANARAVAVEAWILECSGRQRLLVQMLRAARGELAGLANLVSPS